MNAHPVRTLIIIFLLTFFGLAQAQTVEWWDTAPDSYVAWRQGVGAAGIVQVQAEPDGIYAVGRTDCRETTLPAGYVVCTGLLTKYDDTGAVVWQKRLDDRDDTQVNAVAVDATGVYIHGTARWVGRWPSEESFIQRYTHDGELVWTFRDSEGNPKGYRIANVRAQALLLYDGYLYVASRRNLGSFVRKLTLDGELLWLAQAPTGSLAAGDGKIFSSGGPYYGNKGSNTLTVFDTDGNQLNAFRTDTVAENGLQYHDGALYFCGEGQPGNGRRAIYSVQQVWPDGTPGWKVEWGRTDFPESEGCSVDVDANGVIFAGNLRLVHQTAFDANLTVRRYDFDGEEQARWDFPSLVAVPNSVSVRGDEVYLAGWDLERLQGFAGRVSDAPTLPPTMAALGSTTPGLPARLAVLDHHYGAGPVSVVTRDLTDSSPDKLLQFSAGLRPVDFFASPDLNGNGADELVVLSRRPAIAEVMDSGSGELIAHVDLDADFEPLAAVASDGVLAVLLNHPTKNYIRLDEFDARTGAALGSTPFNPNYTPVDLFALPGAGRRYGVLGYDPAPGGQSKLEIRDAGGAVVHNLWLGTATRPQTAIAYDDNGSLRIAMIRQHREQGWRDLAIVDPAAGIVATLPRNSAFSLGPFAYSPDVDANGEPQFTFAGANEAGKVRAETRDLGTALLLHNVYLMPNEPIQDLVVLGTESGVAAPLLGLLVRDDFGAIESRYRVILVDLLSGERNGEAYVQF